MIKREKLVEVGEELNEVLGIRPPITAGESLSEIRYKVSNALWYLEPDDRLTVRIILLLDEMGLINNIRAAQNTVPFPVTGLTITRTKSVHHVFEI